MSIYSTTAERVYNSGVLTQIPVGRVIGVNKRVSRDSGIGIGCYRADSYEIANIIYNSLS